MSLTAKQAYQQLVQGNQRFVQSQGTGCFGDDARRQALVEGQDPFAIILGCADSRVPAEIVFDQGLGDLFVIRVAGNVAAKSQIGSIEYAAQHLGTRLVVVLGHSCCGAVDATLSDIKEPLSGLSDNLKSIIGKIRPAVQEIAQEQETCDDHALLMGKAVRANVSASAAQLRQVETLKSLIDEQGLVVIGAEYDLASGQVIFFDGNETLDS